MALFLVVSFSHAIGRERPLIQLSVHTGSPHLWLQDNYCSVLLRGCGPPKRPRSRL